MNLATSKFDWFLFHFKYSLFPGDIVCQMPEVIFSKGWRHGSNLGSFLPQPEEKEYFG